MIRFSLWFLVAFSALLYSQGAHCQDIARAEKAVFYNFTISKCQDCTKPFNVALDNIRTVNGSFKGVNDRLPVRYEPGSFHFAAYDKRTGAKLWETTMPNPVDVNIEFDGADHHSHEHDHSDGQCADKSHSHNHGPDGGCSLQRITVELPEGQVAVRLPFGPSECELRVSFIERAGVIIPLASF